MTAIPTNVLASVDLGSNSFRLQVCENNNGQLKVIDSFKQMVRFAAGLDEHKNLDEASQERALDCLAKFGERLRGFKPEQVRVVATNTFRVAKNIAQFLPKAEAAHACDDATDDGYAHHCRCHDPIHPIISIFPQHESTQPQQRLPTSVNPPTWKRPPPPPS